MSDLDDRALTDAYCAWLNEATRLRKLMAERDWLIPFPLENLWRRSTESEGEAK